MHREPSPIDATIWSATLTVDAASTNQHYGCNNNWNGLDNCSDALSEDQFTLSGTTYTIDILYWYTTGSSESNMNFGLAGVSGPAEQGALASLTLILGNTAFSIDNSGRTNNELLWENAGNLGWTDGQTVAVSLTKSAASTPSTTTHSAEAGTVVQAVQGALDTLTSCGGVSKSAQAALFADCLALLKARPHLVNEWGSFSNATVHRNKINNFALNWSPDVPLADWFGVKVGNYKGQQRIKQLNLGVGHTVRFEYVNLVPPFHTEVRTTASVEPTLWGRIPDVLGELTALNVIDFTGQRLGGPIPAAIGRLPRLRSLFLANNRLTLASPEAMLPTFEYPQRMERIRLLPNGPVPTDYAYRYIDNEGVEHRACLPAVWLDTDRDNDNLTNRSERNLQGVRYYKGKTNDTDPLFKPCE